MKEAISISGTLLMLDDKTPHVAVPVQAIRDGKVVATVLSDGKGKYRFTNLEQGTYRLRCQVLGGYAYYRATDSALRFTFYDSQKTKSTTNMADALRVQNGKTLKNIDFRFAPFKKGTWKTFTVLDGLANNAVMDIYRDPNGLMWFATQGGGISRYDGNQFLNFTTEDGLTNNYAWSICGGPDDVIWFTTLGGVFRYDGNQFVRFTTQDGLADDRVMPVYRDPDGVMWFGTCSGVSRYDGKEFVNFTTQDGLAGDTVLSIDCFVGFDTGFDTPSTLNPAPRNDSDSVMWFGTCSGVSRYAKSNARLRLSDGKEFVNFTTQDGLVNDHVRCIYRDPDDVLWFGTLNGVSRYDGKEFVRFTTQDGLADDNVMSVYRDPDGVMWFGTQEGGVSRYDGKTFVNFTTADGLASNWVNAIYRDPEGVMWFGTQEGGVSRYDDEVFINFTTKDGLADNTVRSIHGASDDVMWFGTVNGVSRYDGKGGFKNFTTKDGLAGNDVWAIDCFVPRNDADGVMWFATRGGVSRYDGKVFANFTTQDGLPDNRIWSLHRAPDGVMWFGTDGGGVSRYDGKTFVNFTDQDGLGNNLIRTINHDSDGMMWFGTLAGVGGASRYDGETFVNFTIQDGLAGNSVATIYRDDDGVLWFGTGSGVSRYDFDTQTVELSSPDLSRRRREKRDVSKPTQSKDGKRFINLTVKDGLAYNHVLAIHRSSDGMMWFGTWGGGVSWYDGIAWTSLDTRDGLAGNDVSSIYQDSDGYLWFATDGGVTRYRPSATPPRVRILSVKMNGKDAELEAIPPVTVGTHVAMEYSAIDFKTVPEKRQYRCRIREIDSDARSHPENRGWHKPTKATSFDYTFDKPGTYTFEVQAIDRDLNYSEPAILNLTIEPDPALVSMQTELNHLRREVRGKYHFENIIGNSIKMREVRALMESAIDSGLTVLVTGDTGTGKELVAKAIHHSSPRKDNPLMDRNCGAIPTELLASDLFGHRKGAFTGAQEDKAGLFEAASGGTVLLDEISEMPLDAQVHLLRVLEERQVQRLGENVSRDVDVRIIAMTNKDLIEEGKAGRFREDLYYRLSEFPIHIPPLRERPEDIPILAEHFLQEYSQEQKKKLDSFVPGVFEMLQSYSWPGNVRELRNDVRRAAALVEEGERIHINHFPPKITQEILTLQEAMQTIGQKSTRYRELVDGFERRCIEHALRVCEGNRSQAAKMLGLGRKSLYEKMQRLGIDISMLLPEKE